MKSFNEWLNAQSTTKLAWMCFGLGGAMLLILTLAGIHTPPAYM